MNILIRKSRQHAKENYGGQESQCHQTTKAQSKVLAPSQLKFFPWSRDNLMIDKRAFPYQFLKRQFSNYIVNSGKAIKKFPTYKRFQYKVSIVEEQDWFSQPKYRFLKKTNNSNRRETFYVVWAPCLYSPRLWREKPFFTHVCI